MPKRKYGEKVVNKKVKVSLSIEDNLMRALDKYVEEHFTNRASAIKSFILKGIRANNAVEIAERERIAELKDKERKLERESDVHWR